MEPEQHPQGGGDRKPSGGDGKVQISERSKGEERQMERAREAFDGLAGVPRQLSMFDDPMGIGEDDEGVVDLARCVWRGAPGEEEGGEDGKNRSKNLDSSSAFASAEPGGTEPGEAGREDRAHRS